MEKKYHITAIDRKKLIEDEISNMLEAWKGVLRDCV